ncbi:MAG: hypothetical protein DHS20C18_18880 [Saprospiraceae bacterium]|nr:MAG: hypothetical protein DHS20C18_18880 [Saprospiraceae bacterium]
MFVWEKEGKVHIIDTSGQRLSEPLIDLSEEVTNWKDHGLMGFALDPSFLQNGYFYLLYAVDLHHYWHYGTAEYSPDSTFTDSHPTFGRVTRYQANPATQYTSAMPESRKVLLGETITNAIPLVYSFHGLGSIRAATDGTLLISCGDATSNQGTGIGGNPEDSLVNKALEIGLMTPDQDIGSYKAQYLGAYSGKVLRIDAQSGDGLSSNPYFDPENPRSPQSRTWALGLRNPYRIAIKPETGSHYAEEGNPGVIYAGDVGNGGWEEINIIKQGGQNFGWPIYEGFHIQWGFHLAETPLNTMAVNPLFGTGNCDREFFDFKELFVRRTANGPDFVPNPCNPAEPIPDSSFPMIESLPIITWSNAEWNPPTRAEVIHFNEEDRLAPLTIDDPGSGVIGEAFDGYSSMAGVFYQGTQFPEEYHNAYFAIDFSGWIKVFDFDDNHELKAVRPFFNFANQIIYLAQDPGGNLYYINLEGEIHKITYGGNPPPVAIIEADQYYGTSPLPVHFEGDASFDSNLDIASYLWDFGDGTTSTEANPSYTFSSDDNSPQSFVVSLTVTDTEGASNTTEEIISVNNTPPLVNITSFQDGDRYPLSATTSLELIAEVSDAEHDDELLNYEWNTYVHHNAHFHPEPTDYNHRSHVLISPLGCVDENYWFRIELTVTDPSGLSTTDSRQVFPNCDNAFISPIQLSASAQPEKVKLDWTIDFASQAGTFEIQRSNNLFDFAPIGTLSLPITATRKSFQFIDPAPLLGSNIYRIKVIGNDRAYNYSNIASASYPMVSDIRIYPNPADTYFNIEVKEAQTGTMHFELFQVNGARLLTTSWNAAPGKPFEQTILSNFLNNGTYLYRIKNGEAVGTGKLLIFR